MSYVDDDSAWFHGKLAREDAVNILLRYGKKEGFFLVRESSGVPGDYVLTLWGKNQALHFQIQSRGDVYYSIDDGPVFQGLDTLINHYRENANGLPIRLTEFCPGNPPPLSSRKHGVHTALHQACQDGNLNLVRKLINEGFKDVNVRNEDGGTPLHTAASRGFDDVVLVLLKHGADGNSRDSNGYTPLQNSCRAGHASTCSILIEQGNADVQARSSANGFVSMHEAAIQGHDDCIRCLIEHDAPLHPRSLEGDTPRDLSLRFGHMHVVELIDNHPTPPPRFPPKMWLHEHVDRKGAVALIQRWGLVDGLFLVRLSTRDHGYYALSLAVNQQIYHYQIRSRCDRYFYIDDGPLFETLPHLIDHYTKKADGLPVLLKRAIPPNGSPPIHLQTASPQTQRARPPPKPGTPQLIASKSTPSLFHPSSSPKKGLMRRQESADNIHDEPVPPSSRKKVIAPARLIRSMSEQPRPQKGALPPLPLPQEPDDTNKVDDVIDGKPLPPTPTSAPARPPPRGVRRPPPPIPGKVPSPTSLGPGSPELPVAVPSKVMQTSPGQQTLITKESLELGPELGQGEFGSVLKGTWTNTKGAKVPVALKTLHPEKIVHGEQEFLREARIMFGLDHPCIVRLIGVCLGPPLILVQELVSMGALLDFLIDHQQDITQRDLKLWAAQIAWGMMYLEKRRFVHRDLATRNILMSTKHQMKISDFGLSRAVGSGSDYYKASHGGRWPVKWYAPESINYGTFSHKSDVWSYGVTLWEMYSFGQLPYGDMSGAEVIRMLEEEGKRLEQPQDCPEHTFSLMLQCWDLKPEKRPTFAELHNIFSTNPLYSDVKLPLKEKPAS